MHPPGHIVACREQLLVYSHCSATNSGAYSSAPTTPFPASPKTHSNTPAEGSSNSLKSSSTPLMLFSVTENFLSTPHRPPSQAPTPDLLSEVSSSQQRLKHTTKRELHNFAKAYQLTKMGFIRFLFLPQNDFLTLSSNPSPTHKHIHRHPEAGVKRAKEKGKQKLGLSPCIVTHSLLVHSQTHTPSFLLRVNFSITQSWGWLPSLQEMVDVKYCNLIIKIPAKM